MAPSVLARTAQVQVLYQGARPTAAAVDVLNLDIDPHREWRVKVARAVRYAIDMSHLTDDEVAGCCGVDASEVGRWTRAERRPHFDRLFAIPAVGGWLAIELAKLLAGVEVSTEIRLRHVGGVR